MEEPNNAEPTIEPTPIPTPPSCIEIAKALCEVQKTELFALTDSENPFHNSKYADLSSVWAAIRQPLTDNGFSILQETEPYEGGITVVTTLLHVSGESRTTRLSIKVPAKKDKQGNEISNIQALGSAITYLRRYSLAAMIGVCPTDDDGETAMHREKATSASVTKEVKKSSPAAKAEAKRADATKNAAKPSTKKDTPKKTPAKPKPIDVHESPKNARYYPIDFPDTLEEFGLPDYAMTVTKIDERGTHCTVNGRGIWHDLGADVWHSNAPTFNNPTKCIQVRIVAAVEKFGVDVVTKAFPNVTVVDATTE